jgi:hypothetical protein
MSTAYAFCHELRHIMFAKDGLYTNNTNVNEKEAKASRPEEELACDIWARDFLTSRIGVYAKQQNVEFDRVLAKRSIAAAIGIFVLYETTERIGDAGDEAYPLRISRQAGPGFHVMPGHPFMACRARVSRHVGPAFHACRATVS